MRGRGSGKDPSNCFSFFCQDWGFLDEVVEIALEKLKKKRGSQDVGFECLIQIKLGSYLLKEFRGNKDVEVRIDEKFYSGIKPDIFLESKNDSFGALIELKSITDNNFSWLKGDINKLKSLHCNFEKFLLSV
ncbi:hypothetical protein [Thermovibrio sp.]